jgi:hypothetical protein
VTLAFTSAPRSIISSAISKLLEIEVRCRQVSPSTVLFFAISRKSKSKVMICEEKVELERNHVDIETLYNLPGSASTCFCTNSIFPCAHASLWSRIDVGKI